MKNYLKQQEFNSFYLRERNKMSHQDMVDKISEKMVDVEIKLSNVNKAEPADEQERLLNLIKQYEYNGYLSACTDIVKIIIADFEESKNVK